jgi:ABC-type transporter Mla subunit MlaD
LKFDDNILSNHLKQFFMPNENLDNLVKEVTETTDVMSSAVTLLNGLGATVKQIKAELAALNIDNATLNELSTALDTRANELAAAITANTDAEPEPEV